MPIRLAIHGSILLSSNSGALDGVRFDKEMDEQNQIRAEEPACEQRSVFSTCTVGGLGQEGREAGMVACSTCAQNRFVASQTIPKVGAVSQCNGTVGGWAGESKR
jgi:hypothetical protein